MRYTPVSYTHLTLPTKGEVHTELKVGSRIMFAGGVYGKVVSIDDEDTLRVEVAPKVVITISRYAVQSLLK